MEDTISAVATALGEGAVGIIRISGPESLKIADKLFSTKKGLLLGAYNPRHMVYGYVKDNKDKEFIARIDKNVKSMLYLEGHEFWLFDNKDLVKID